MIDNDVDNYMQRLSTSQTTRNYGFFQPEVQSSEDINCLIGLSILCFYKWRLTSLLRKTSAQRKVAPTAGTEFGLSREKGTIAKEVATSVSSE